MDFKKLLIFLCVCILYINYENYFKLDTNKLHREINSIKSKIKQEESLTRNKNMILTHEVNLDNLVFLAKKYSYSKAMGKMQEEITDSITDLCTVGKIKWSQTSASTQWYEALRMNVSVSCKPNSFHQFINNLRKTKKLYKIENFRITKNNRKELLSIHMQLIGYRVK